MDVLYVWFVFCSIRWRGNLAELMVKVERYGDLRQILDIRSEIPEGTSA